MPEVSVPQIVWKQYEYNASNPFKKRVRREHLYCNLCHRDILSHGITKIEDWNKIRSHLKLRHKIDPGEEIPLRFLSVRLWAKFLDSDKEAKP